jgi:FSR family fosmidomycin resistance protein-like MFS transporter
MISRLVRRRVGAFVLTLLAIEFLDEFVFGTREAAWPLIRDDLGLTYAQIGLLLGVPGIIASLIEPALGILGDVWKRRVLILGGGVMFALSCVFTAVSQSFWPLMLTFIVFYPASGAFVSLSQSALMDIDPARHEQNMARWTFAGSAGVVTGSLLLSVAVNVGLGWRGLFAALGLLAGLLVVIASRFPFPNGASEDGGKAVSFRQGVRNALDALRRREVLRWLTLLQFSDLMLDILLGYLALYMVDVAGVSEAEAGVAVAVWSVVGLAGDLALIPLLERVRGLSYLRISVLLELALYPAFLLVEGYVPKLIILGLLGFFNSGWYSILAGQLYTSMPGLSGTVMTVNNVFGLAGSLIPLGIGLVAERVGLQGAMWLLLLGPVALLVGIPRKIKIYTETQR